MRFSGRGERGRAGVVCRQAGDNPLQHPGAAQVQAVEVRELRIARIGRDGDREPVRLRRRWQLRQEFFQPLRELRRREDAPHHVRFAERRRDEIFAARLVGERRVLVVEVELARLFDQQLLEVGILHRARVVDHQSEREGSLRMLADTNRVREFPQPFADPLDRRCLPAGAGWPASRALADLPTRAARSRAGAAMPIHMDARSSRDLRRADTSTPRRCFRS